MSFLAIFSILASYEIKRIETSHTSNIRAAAKAGDCTEDVVNTTEEDEDYFEYHGEGKFFSTVQQASRK